MSVKREANSNGIEKITRICTTCTNICELSIGYSLEGMMYWDSDYSSKTHQLNPESDEYDKDNDFSLDKLFNSLPTNLVSLDVSKFQIKDRHLKLITERCPKLSNLDLSETFITTKSLDTLKANLPQLCRLTVTSLWIKDEKKYQTLFEQGKMPQLKYFCPVMKYGFGYESDFSDPMDEIEEKGLKELFPNVNFADEVKFRIAHPDQD